VQPKLFLDSCVFLHYAELGSEYQSNAEECIQQTWITSETVRREVEHVVSRRQTIYATLIKKLANVEDIEITPTSIFELFHGNVLQSDEDFFRRISNKIFTIVSSADDTKEALIDEITHFFSFYTSRLNQTVIRITESSDRIISTSKDTKLYSRFRKIFKSKQRHTTDSQILTDCVEYASIRQDPLFFVTTDSIILDQKEAIVNASKEHFHLSIAPIQLFFIAEKISFDNFEL